MKIKKYFKLFTIICILIVFSLSIWGGIKLGRFIKIKTAKIEVILNDNLTIEFNDKRKVSDYIKSINGQIVDDYYIDSSKVGVQNIKFNFINDDGIRVSYDYKIEVIDTVEPVIWLGNTYRLKKGNQLSIDSILCGDNYDSNPHCYIEGLYDSSKVGDYSLVFKAIDQSGNVAIQPFTLKVYEPMSDNKQTKTNPQPRTMFADVITNYKTANTKIGIDVSKWQGDIDFPRLKKAGVEFIIIRVGGTRGTNGEYFLDSKFKQNIEGAKAYNIPVGLYFYSYANSREHAIRDALWVYDNIKDYDIELPIAFDWEEWSSFNKYNLSFFELTSIGEAFLEKLEEYGYKGMLYSSKSYLEYIWFPTKYDIWLAHYTNKTNYQGRYKIWQMCDNGLVDGINGNVDIDIMYN